MLSGLASGGNAAAALCCAQLRADFILLICRSMGTTRLVIAYTHGKPQDAIDTWTACAGMSFSKRKRLQQGTYRRLYRAADYTAVAGLHDAAKSQVAGS